MASQIQDESTLAEIGYKQELRRDWSMLHNFGISFSVIVCELRLPAKSSYRNVVIVNQHLIYAVNGMGISSIGTKYTDPAHLQLPQLPALLSSFNFGTGNVCPRSLQLLLS